MRHLFSTCILISSLSIVAGGAQAAGYIKIGDIKGESTTAADANHDKWIDVLSIDWGDTGADGRQNAVLTVKEGAKRAGLLLPAVQAARASSKPRRVSERLRHKGRLTYRETSGARDVKTFVFNGVDMERPRATGRAGATHQIAMSYKCKSWTVVATGETGTDCAGPGRANKKGNAETTWKVEKGEK